MNVHVLAGSRSRLVVLGLAVVLVTAMVGCQFPSGAGGAASARSSSASGSSLPHIDNTNLPMSVNVSLDLAAYQSSNNPGPWITFSGFSALGGFGVNWIFSNNLKNTQVYTVDNSVNVTVQPAGAAITIPKQPVDGSVGGNPYLFVQLINAGGDPVSDVIFVGRVVQGSTWHTDIPVTIPAAGNVTVTGIDCSNSPGPYITFESSLAFAGLSLRIYFSNQDSPDGVHNTSVIRDFSLIGAGQSFSFPKQPVNGGVGGNPWIFAALEDGGGERLSDPVLLGRCVQLCQDMGM